jgi:hypothetical protein
VAARFRNVALKVCFSPCDKGCGESITVLHKAASKTITSGIRNCKVVRVLVVDTKQRLLSMRVNLKKGVKYVKVYCFLKFSMKNQGV